MASLLRDVGNAVRRLAAAPVFTIFSVVTLGAGIGVTTAVYSIVEIVIGPPRGIPNLDRLVDIRHAPAEQPMLRALSLPDFEDLRDRQRSFSGVAGWARKRFAAAANGRAETILGEVVSGEYFDVAGVTMTRGRPIQPSDDLPGAPLVAVVSDRFWRRTLDGRDDVIGRTIRVNGSPVEVVGVAPAAFPGLESYGVVPTAVWVPMSALSRLQADRRRDTREDRWILVFARLADGRTLDQAADEVTRIARDLAGSSPIEDARRWHVRRMSEGSILEGLRPVGVPLVGAVLVSCGLVLLVACTNVANLVLARGATRRHELAVRLALGASRARLVREALVETVLLVGAAGLVAVLLARLSMMQLLTAELGVGNGFFLRVAPEFSGGVLWAAGISSALALLVAGLVPALQSARADVRAVLASDGAQTAAPRWRGRRRLITAQVAVSVILVSVAALCVARIRQIGRDNHGLDTAHLALAEVDFASQHYSPERAATGAADIAERLGKQAGVESVAVSAGLPTFVSPPFVYLKRGAISQRVIRQMAGTPDLFRTLGVVLTHGRVFDERDSAAAPRVAIISESAAQDHWGTTDVIGRQVFVQSSAAADTPSLPLVLRTVVGVARDVHERSRPVPVLYVPLSQQPEGRLVISGRATGDPAPLVLLIRQAMASVDADLAPVQMTTGPALAAVNENELFYRISGGLTAVLGSLALVLAMVGLFGVLSHVVARRTREIGVRVALGAEQAHIIRMVLRDGLRPVLSGLGVGLAIVLIGRLSLGGVFDRFVPAADVSLVLIPVALVAVGLVACYLPARRAARVDPNVALRDL